MLLIDKRDRRRGLPLPLAAFNRCWRIGRIRRELRRFFEVHRSLPGRREERAVPRRSKLTRALLARFGDLHRGFEMMATGEIEDPFAMGRAKWKGGSDKNLRLARRKF